MPPAWHDAALSAWLASRGDGRERADLDEHVGAVDGAVWTDGQDCPSHGDAANGAFAAIDLAFGELSDQVSR